MTLGAVALEVVMVVINLELFELITVMEVIQHNMKVEVVMNFVVGHQVQ